jgi:hypothetical protein
MASCAVCVCVCVCVCACVRACVRACDVDGNNAQHPLQLFKESTLHHVQLRFPRRLRATPDSAQMHAVCCAGTPAHSVVECPYLQHLAGQCATCRKALDHHIRKAIAQGNPTASSQMHLGHLSTNKCMITGTNRCLQHTKQVCQG